VKSLTQSVKQLSDRRLYVERSSLNCRRPQSNIVTLIANSSGQVPVSLPPGSAALALTLPCTK
jgi:hypothetical protein